MMMAADDAAFESLTREISRVVGVPLDIYKSKCLRRRIAVRMRACGVHTFDEYLGVLSRTPAADTGTGPPGSAGRPVGVSRVGQGAVLGSGSVCTR